MAFKRHIERRTDAPLDPRTWGARCDVCPLKGSKPVFGDGNPKALIAIVGEAPGREEITVGIPFIGASGSMLEGMLEYLGVHRPEVWLDNAIACFPPGGDLNAYLQKTRKEYKQASVEFIHPVECCRPRLFRALGVPVCRNCGKWMRGPNDLVCVCKTPKWKKWDKPMVDTTVPTGNAGMKAVLGVDGITEHRGYVEDMKQRRTALVTGATVGLAERAAGQGVKGKKKDTKGKRARKTT